MSRTSLYIIRSYRANEDEEGYIFVDIVLFQGSAQLAEGGQQVLHKPPHFRPGGVLSLGETDVVVEVVQNDKHEAEFYILAIVLDVFLVEDKSPFAQAFHCEESHRIDQPKISHLISIILALLA